MHGDTYLNIEIEHIVYTNSGLAAVRQVIASCGIDGVVSKADGLSMLNAFERWLKDNGVFGGNDILHVSVFLEEDGDRFGPYGFAEDLTGVNIQRARELINCDSVVDFFIREGLIALVDGEEEEKEVEETNVDDTQIEIDGEARVVVIGLSPAGYARLSNKVSNLIIPNPSSGIHYFPTTRPAENLPTTEIVRFISEMIAEVSGANGVLIRINSDTIKEIGVGALLNFPAEADVVVISIDDDVILDPQVEWVNVVGILGSATIVVGDEDDGILAFVELFKKRFGVES